MYTTYGKPPTPPDFLIGTCKYVCKNGKIAILLHKYTNNSYDGSVEGYQHIWNEWGKSLSDPEYDLERGFWSC